MRERDTKSTQLLGSTFDVCFLEVFKNYDVFIFRTCSIENLFIYFSDVVVEGAGGCYFFKSRCYFCLLCCWLSACCLFSSFVSEKKICDSLFICCVFSMKFHSLKFVPAIFATLHWIIDGVERMCEMALIENDLHLSIALCVCVGVHSIDIYPERDI